MTSEETIQERVSHLMPVLRAIAEKTLAWGEPGDVNPEPKDREDIPRAAAALMRRAILVFPSSSTEGAVHAVNTQAAKWAEELADDETALIHELVKAVPTLLDAIDLARFAREVTITLYPANKPHEAKRGPFRGEAQRFSISLERANSGKVRAPKGTGALRLLG